MQIVSKELSAGTASMTIIDTEERTSRPRLMLAVLWLDDVEDDRDSILVVVTHQSLVCIGSIGSNDSIAFVAALSGLVIRDDNACSWRQR